MDLPDHCLRGLRTADLSKDGQVSAQAFKPNEKTAGARDDGAQESSVNWEDDDTVLHQTLTARNESGSLLFAHGAVRVPRAELDHVAGLPQVQHGFSYERSALPGNPYHGNLLFHKHLPKQTINLIIAFLALVSSPVINHDDK